MISETLSYFRHVLSYVNSISLIIFEIPDTGVTLFLRFFTVF